MKNSLRIIFATTIFVVSVIYAQAQTVNEEAIRSYKSDVVVNTDNSINVTEEIVYQTGSTEHHGIYRDIYPYSSQDKKMSIDNVMVQDEVGGTYKFQVQNVGGNVRIKIGDPNTTFRGEKTYIIKYRAMNAVAKLRDIDEIYWNTTGNEWGMPIYSALATVTLPPGVKATQKSCYFGPKGSTDRCTLLVDGTVSLIFTAPTMLAARSGLTVAVGFPKDILPAYPLRDRIWEIFLLLLPWVIAVALPVIVALFSYRYWNRYGRDPKGSNVIVPQYDVPDGLTPMEVFGIIKENISAESISAEIVYLATRGYLRIEYIEEKVLGLFKSKDYQLVKLKDFTDISNGFDKELLQKIFSSSHSSLVKLSKLKNVFYRHVPTILGLVVSALLEKGYYRNLGRLRVSSPDTQKAIAFIGIFLTIFILMVLATISYLQVVAGVFASVCILVTTYYLSPAKTEKGVMTKEYLLGLKMYLQIAEKDRLQFHNAPEKKPEIFEKLLPYAMVLGVEKAWAKEFEGVYLAPPSWYSGPVGSNFNAVALSASLSDFNSFAVSSMTSSPGGGGSGGGGSSGGGGGGGGGGSW